jgi:3-phenylpropionate/cinnamic acid dioxygenase small subunit
VDLGEMADRIEIRELTARYNTAIDDGRLDDYLETFTVGASFEVSGVPAAKGAAEIRALVAAIPWGHVHAATDSVIDIRGDTATQQCTLLVIRRSRDKGEQSVLATGRYIDDLVRTVDGWRFSARRADLDFSLPTMVGLLSPSQEAAQC